jgi:hypothetical protein
LRPSFCTTPSGNEISSRTAEIERIVADLDVLGDVEVALGLGAAEHGLDASDEFRVAERLGDVVVAADVEALDLAGFLDVAGDEDHRDGNVGRLQIVDEGEARLVGQVDVEQDQVREIFLQEPQGVLRPVADLRVHARLLEMRGEQRGEFRLVFDNDDEGLGFRACRSRSGHETDRSRILFTIEYPHVNHRGRAGTAILRRRWRSDLSAGELA